MNEFFTSPLGILVIAIYLFLLAVYLLAIKKSTKNELTVFSGNIDYIAFVVFAVSGGLAVIIKHQNAYDSSMYFLIVTSIVALIITTYFSIKSNSGNAQHILISIGAKIFIISVLLIIFILYFVELMNADSKENKDKRFKDGTRGNLRIASDNRNSKLKNYLVKNLIK